MFRELSEKKRWLNAGIHELKIKKGCNSKKENKALTDKLNQIGLGPISFIERRKRYKQLASDKVINLDGDGI